MSFTAKIKEEISNIETSKSVSIAELSAYIRNNGNFLPKKITMTTENKFLIEHIVKKIQEIYQLSLEIEIIENMNFSKRDLYQISISNTNLNILQDLNHEKPFDEDTIKYYTQMYKKYKDEKNNKK